MTLLVGCVYTWLTIATTSDAGLLTNSKSSPLPILQAEISLTGFYIVTPFLLVCVYIYFQVYLQRLWERLADAPAVFPDGRLLSMKVSPWFFTGLANVDSPYLRRARPPLARLQAAICILLAWILLPVLTLPWLWLRYLPKHDWTGTIIHILLLLLTFGFAMFTYLNCRATLRNGTRNPGTFGWWGIWSGLAAFSMFSILSYGAFSGVHGYYTLMLEVKPGEGSSENIPDQFPVSGPIEFWVPVLLSYFHTPFPSLVKADVSQKPDNWDGINLILVKGAQLDYANLRYANAANAFFANGNLEGVNLEWGNLRGADFRAAKLKNANLNRAFLVESLFQGANLTNAHLYRANLLEAKLNNADLSRAKLQGARLHGAQLQGAKLLEADLRGAEFQPANIGRVEFGYPGATTNTTVLTAYDAANLAETDLQLARLEGARLGRVRGLTQEQINKACLDDKTQLPTGLVRPPPCPNVHSSKILSDNYYPQQ